MKLADSNLITISTLVALIVLSFSVPTKPQTSADVFPVAVDSGDHEFTVKFKGEIYSWKNLSQLLRQHNIPVPHENVLTAVLEQKTVPHQSCIGRCFLDERKYSNKTCFCDMACKMISDCCLDFNLRCGHTGNDGLSLQDFECGDVNEKRPWSGAIMKSSCSPYVHKSTGDCQTVERLNLALQKELPVFGLEHNITYRSNFCARCNNEGNLSFWGINISCEDNFSITTPVTITLVKTFLKEHPKCLWKYAPLQNRQRQYRSCVLHDTQCASSHLPVMSVAKELCYSYSMVFSVVIDINQWTRKILTFRNPHCALCNPESKSKKDCFSCGTSTSPPLSILLDLGSKIFPPEEQTSSQVELIPVPDAQNITSQMFNCTSGMNNCTILFGGQKCRAVFTLTKNQPAQVSSLNKSRVMMMMRSKNISFDKNAMDLKENTTYILCPGHQVGRPTDKDQKHGSTILIYITLACTSLSIISLCFLLGVYLSFKELRNLPGKCMINLSLALLCYQSIFLGAAKSSTEISALCKAVAIFLHFFVLAAFSWMTVMAFDTRKKFSVKVSIAWRQPSDTKKTFIKYCIVGWGLPAVVVVFCFVLDVTGTFHFGYGNSTYCWISNKTALAAALVIPLSFALAFNTVCLVKNARAIRRLQQGSSLATNKSSRPSLPLICIKLTTVMGLTWVLGLIANWKQAAFLQYPSTGLNSMQGFFIALCFTTTKKVRTLIKERFCNRGNGASEPEGNVPRDKREGITGTGPHTFEIKYLSTEQARQNSS